MKGERTINLVERERNQIPSHSWLQIMLASIHSFADDRVDSLLVAVKRAMRSILSQQGRRTEAFASCIAWTIVRSLLLGPGTQWLLLKYVVK